jgi:hypothetical protein
MDLSPILGMQARAPGRLSQTSSSDFSDQLNKDMPREASKSPREDLSQERISQTSEQSASDAFAASQDENGMVLGPLAVTDTGALSTVASVEQVLSARVFGLHLQASGYLSEYRLASADNEPSAPPAELSAIQAVGTPARSPLQEGSVTASALTDASGSALGAMGITNVVLPEIAAAASTGVDAMALPLSGAAAWREITWQQRALRLIARPDGKHTAWLRDYSVSTDEARQLATSLARQLKGQGLALHSIIWNGHEVWSSVDVD